MFSHFMTIVFNVLVTVMKVYGHFFKTPFSLGLNFMKMRVSSVPRLNGKKMKPYIVILLSLSQDLCFSGTDQQIKF